MNACDAKFEVRSIGSHDPSYQRALHIALEVPRPPGAKHPHRIVDEFLQDADRRDLRVHPLSVAVSDSDLIASALVLESPGRAALVLAAAAQGRAPSTDSLSACLIHPQASAWENRILLLQLLLRPENRVLSQAAKEAGFRPVTRLLYLRRPGAGAPDRPPGSSDLRWATYGAASHSLFADAIRRSYLQSLDCPELTNQRTLDDVLASHRASGDFDPNFWWIAIWNDEPIGVMLLNRFARQPAMEIVYMGVAAAHRGRGVGDALLAKALDTASSCAIELTHPLDLVLAVDERNDPARRLYARWGFFSIGEREAWIATSPGAEG